MDLLFVPHADKLQDAVEHRGNNQLTNCVVYLMVQQC